MNYYERYVGDFQRDTGLLSCAEVGAYDRMLDHYYATESPLPADYDKLYGLCRAIKKPDQEAVRSVADQFFPVAADGMRHNKRADEEIAKAQGRINAAKENGKKGGRPRGGKQNQTEHKPNGFPTANPAETHSGVHHEPQVNHLQEEATSTTNTTRGASDHSSSPPPRAFQIIKSLTRLEAGRGKALSPVVTTDKVLAAWVEAGVTDAQIEEAHGLAVAKRQKDGDQSPVNIGFMDVFVAKVVNPKDGGSAVVGVKREWHDSNAEVQKKGEELGLKWVDYLSSGRMWPIYKRDVLARCGIDWTPESGDRRAA